MHCTRSIYHSNNTSLEGLAITQHISVMRFHACSSARHDIFIKNGFVGKPKHLINTCGLLDIQTFELFKK